MRNFIKKFMIFGILGFLLAALLPVQSVYANTITVNSLDDSATAGDGLCTLREAINNANSNSDTSGADCAAGSGADTISFSVSGEIVVSSAFPRIIDDDTTIDGGGAITLNGNGGAYPGLEIRSSRSRIDGLIIHSFGQEGILVEGYNYRIDGVEIVNCHIGTDGTAALGNGRNAIYIPSQNDSSGVRGANDILIEDNVVAASINGTSGYGIRVREFSSRSVNVRIVGNTVGTDVTGTVALPNGIGIYVTGIQTLTIENNLISGNYRDGIQLDSVTDTLIISNVIGTDRTGSVALPNNSAAIGDNGTAGIYAYDSATMTLRANLISGNGRAGVALQNLNHGTLVGNKIGTDISLSLIHI